MHICYISQEYPPDTGWGGIGTYTRTMARAMARLGHSVDVITRSLSIDYSCLDQGVRVHRIAQPQLSSSVPISRARALAVYAYAYKVLQKVVELNRMFPLDVVEFPEFDAEGFALVQEFAHIPLVVRLHTPTALTAQYNGRAMDAGDVLVDAMERYSVTRATAVTAPSRFVVGQVERLWGVSLDAKVIPNPVDYVFFCPREAGAKRVIPPPVVLFVGRLEPLKGPKSVLLSVSRVAKVFPEVRFVFIGRDTNLGPGGTSYLKYLQEMVSEAGISRQNLRFVLSAGPTEVARYLRNADVVVATSLFEALGYVPLEAMACGIPTVIGRNSGLREFIGEDEAVFIDPQSPTEISEAIVSLLANPGLREQLGGKAREAVIQLFHPAGIAAQAAEWYQGLAGKKEAPDFHRRSPSSPLSSAAGQPIEGVVPRGAGEWPRIGIVVLTHNALDYTRRCLSSLLQYTEVPCEVHVVDNGSTDGTPEWLGTISDPRVFVHLMGRNTGVPAGRNEGLLGLGRVDFVVFLDNDVEVFPRWWEPLLAAFEDPTVGAAGHQGYRLAQHADRRELQPVASGRCDILTGFAIMVRREVVEQVGLFDELLGNYWHDDDDYSLRVLACGYHNVVVPDQRLLHYGSRSSTSSPEVLSRERSVANQSYLYTKWKAMGLLGPDGRPRSPTRFPVEARKLTLGTPYTLGHSRGVRMLVVPPETPSVEAWTSRLAPLCSRLRGREEVTLLLPFTPGPFASREDMMEQLERSLEAGSDGDIPDVLLVDALKPLSTGLAILRAADMVVTASEGDDQGVVSLARRLGKPVLGIDELGRVGFGPKLCVRWEGSQFVYHSLALVNREITLRLAQDPTIELSLLPYEPHEFGVEVNPRYLSIEECLDKPLSRSADVHIQHRWPPKLEPPADGRWVVIQPWEFGSVPKAWVEAWRNNLDELWVPSGFVRDCYVRAGIPEGIVHVIYNGVDPEVFRPDGPRLELARWCDEQRVDLTTCTYKFLFVGGTIFRKGIDLLLEAYCRAFTHTDPVCLIIKELGANKFYRGQSAADQIRQVQRNPDAPRVLYLEDTFTEEEMARLYRTADCLVHPFRGEGFALPVAEAMATGIPVIASAYGPALEICDHDRAYLVPGSVFQFAENRVGGLETVGRPWLFQPDVRRLAEVLRYVVDHQDEARSKGENGRRYVTENLTWDHTCREVRRRMQVLSCVPPRRLAAGNRPTCP